MTDTDDPHFTLSADHPAFAGHFPGHPIVPGALILDEVIRRASLRHGTDRWTVRSAKFVHPAFPDQALAIVFVDAAQRGSIDFRVEAGETLIASGTLMTPLVEGV